MAKKPALSSREMQRLLTQQAKVLNVLRRCGDLIVMFNAADFKCVDGVIHLNFKTEEACDKALQLWNVINKSEAVAGPSVTQRLEWFVQIADAIRKHVVEDAPCSGAHTIPATMVEELFATLDTHLAAEKDRRVPDDLYPSEPMPIKIHTENN